MPVALLVIIAAFGFGGWPVLARYGGLSAAWANVMLSVITAVGMTAYYWQPIGSQPPISIKQVLIGLLIGACNIAAMVAFGKLYSEYPERIAPAQALMPVVTTIGLALVLGLKLEAHHFIGLVIISVGIYIFTRP